ncbi:hypothetical protein DFA_02807 [Cavenderia fasciculata]|uniref:EGF-like domain-containing protein n=1 Tax=Cavenderia fasciculata TaxID=261658 RepID=F4PID0_CACFS|nr:uncharacterized protein DFA_02807 [Cavenderia fasciculata]EGG24564.1 hypothetical protein DFA_02807 [Cavenderia fasciculata]|eukprot:XP_004362415.1 hypothetical protein DFA_02807 [Cavenderia fasciculata]
MGATPNAPYIGAIESKEIGNFGMDQSYVLVSINEKQCKLPRFIGNGLNNLLVYWIFVEPNSTFNQDESYNNVTVIIRVAEMVTTKVTKMITSIAKECPNNCSNHGVCIPILGACECYIGYQSLSDCSFLLVKPHNSTDEPNSFDINFKSGIQLIREIDQNNSTIGSISMDNVTWVRLKRTSIGITEIIGTIL